MAWQEPKVNWEAGDIPSSGDFNRIEGNTQHLKDTKAESADLNTHINNKTNPHGVTKSQVGLGNVDNIQQATKTEFNSHVNNKSNPHGVTAAQIGAATTSQLGNKIDKPASAVSGNIAVFDGGAGKLKDGGKTIDDFRTNASSAGRYTGSMSGDDNSLRYTSTGVDFKQAIITYKASDGKRVRIFCDFNRDRYVDLDGGGGYLPAPASSYSGNSFRFSHKSGESLCFRSTDGSAGNKNFEVDWGVW